MAAAIVLAAGSGRRMKRSRPKQYLALEGIPVLTRTLRAFDDHPEVKAIILVVAPEEAGFCRDHIVPDGCRKKDIVLVHGGGRRQDSVYEGLAAARRLVEDREIVLIHDGVRPFVPDELISACIAGAKEHGACIPGFPALDTMKRVDRGGMVSDTVSREDIWLIQTPQAFVMGSIRAAFEEVREKGVAVTDDAGVLEFSGYPVQVISGSRENIKITTPADFALAEAMIRYAG